MPVRTVKPAKTLSDKQNKRHRVKRKIIKGVRRLGQTDKTESPGEEKENNLQDKARKIRKIRARETEMGCDGEEPDKKEVIYQTASLFKTHTRHRHE